METPSAYIPIDRRLALAAGRDLPERSQGTALFADISGFTPLTEMLARAFGPKRGAEELTIYLNRVYDALINELYRFGGSVIGFAGDAITCWFEQDDGQRATATALAMQQAMRQFADLQVAPGETVSLAMKASVAVGAVRRFIVGDPDYLLVDAMAGATLEHLAEGEHQANKGDVILDAAAAASLGNRIQIAEWRVDEHTADRFAVVTGLNVAVADQPWPPIDPATLTVDRTRSWLLPPVYRRVRAGGGEFLAELRSAAALFMRFTGIDYDTDPAAPEKLDAFIRQVEHILLRYDGSLLQLTIGDKGSYLYAAFGAPNAHEDDVDRAASAALELQALPAQFSFLQPVQIGVTYGRMRVGAYGGTRRRTYGVLGDSVNLSARLMQAAPPGQILVSDEACARASERFIWEDLPAIRVKGKSEPIALRRLLRARQRRSGVSLETLYPQTPIGRETTLTKLDACLTQLLAGQGQVVRLVGDAGTGKSHLAAHFIRKALAQGVRFTLGVSQSVTRSATYTPWRQVFFTLLDLEDSDEADTLARLTQLATTDHPAWALRLPLLGDLLGLPIPDNPTTAAMDSDLRQKTLFSLLVEMLQFFAQEQPLLIALENAHWMDEASQALTQTLTQQAAGTAPILILLIHRLPMLGETQLLPGLIHLPNLVELPLGEMSAAEVAALMQRQLGGPPSPLLLDLVQRMARGNPFFVSELLSAMQQGEQLTLAEEAGMWRIAGSLFDVLRRADFIQQADGQWHLKIDAELSEVKLGLPDSIHGLVLSRLDRLPEAHKLTLKVSSVVGHSIDLALVARAHPEESDVPTLASEVQYMESEELVREEIPEEYIYAFRHHVTQEVTYETLLYTQRQQLHRAVAQALADQQPEAIPQIAHHAFLGQIWPLALQYNLLAGQQARRLHATQQGIDFLQKALSSAQHLPEADTARDRTQIHLALGELYVSTGQYAEAGETLLAAIDLAHAQGDHDAEAQSCRWYGRAYEQQGEYAEALTWLDKGFAALNGSPSLEKAELSLLAGLINARQGNFARARELCDRGMQVGVALNDIAVQARTYNLLGGIIELRSDSSRAIERCQESLRQYEQIGNVYGQATSHNLIANGYFARGELSLADGHYRQSLDLFTQIGHVYNQVLVNNNLGGIAIKQGRLEAALGYYQQATRQLTQIGGSLWVLGALHLNIGNTLIQRAELDAAAIELQRALDYFEQGQVRDLLPELYGLFAELHLRQNDLDSAEDYGQRSLELARELETPREEGYTLRIVGEIELARARLPEAERYFQASYMLLSKAGDNYERARTQLALVRLYAATDRAELARSGVAQAAEVFTRLGAQLDLPEAQRLSAQLQNQS